MRQLLPSGREPMAWIFPPLSLIHIWQEVKQGEVIGYVGTTGNSTGNHLHFEVWQNGERTDALGFFKAGE